MNAPLLQSLLNRQAEINHQGPIELGHIIVRQSSYALAKFRFWNACYFVDHQLARFQQTIYGARFDVYPRQWSSDEIACEGNKSHRFHFAEPFVPYDDDGTRLPGVVWTA